MTLTTRKLWVIQCQETEIVSMEEFAEALKEYFVPYVYKAGVFETYEDGKGSVYVELNSMNDSFFHDVLEPLVEWLYTFIQSHTLPAPQPR